MFSRSRSRSRILNMLLEDSDSDDEPELLAIAALEELNADNSERLPRPHGGSIRGHRFIWRDRGNSHKRLFLDYFAENPVYSSTHFRKRFRMSRSLFLRILSQVEAHDHYFVQKRNASGVSGLSSIQKVTAAMMILTHGATMDALDECLGIGESTVIESLKRFIKAVIELYADEYLRTPNKTDIARLLAEGERRGFPGMLGSIDCMHWKWKNCPIKWRQKYVGHDHRYEPTVVFEGVASYDLWIWHAYFGLPWSHNHINVPEHSALFVDLVNGSAAPADYSINKHSYKMGYYLASDIYPPWSMVVKTNSEARNNRVRRFGACHESARKDVERAFEVLQSRFAFVRGPPRFWQRDTLKHILTVCIILHNMIVEDERGAVDLDFNYDGLDENLRVAGSHEHTTEFMEFLERYRFVKSEEANSQLQADLMEHLWQIGCMKPWKKRWKVWLRVVMLVRAYLIMKKNVNFSRNGTEILGETTHL